MNVTLQKPDSFGKNGPQVGDHILVTEIRKDGVGDYWIRGLSRTEGVYNIYWIPLDDVLVPNTDGTETVWSTCP